MSDSTPKFVHLSESDARDVLFAEMLEKRAGGDRRWSAGNRDAATRDAKRLAGEGVCARDFLPLRARLVAARLHEDPANAFGTTSFRRASLALTVILGLAALMSGMLTDHLATEGARINLLSPPLLLLIVWNLAVYLLIILKPLMPSGTSRRPLSVREFLSRSLLKAAGSSAVSVEAGTALFLPQCRWLVARALHIAAILFAAGLLAGMAVRGIGTAYHVGWESTWLADNPEAVHTVLNTIYGHLPFCPPVPDVSAVAALAFDAQTASAVDAAPWLLRLMCLLALAIILPRLLLVLKCTVGLAASRRRVRIDLESPYYRSILSVSDAPAVRTTVIVDSTDSVDGLPAHWHDFKAKLKTAEPGSGDVDLLADSAWDGTTSEVLAAIKPAIIHRLLLAFDPSSTPEVEVHGAMMDAAASWCTSKQSPAPVVVLDLSRINRRFGRESPAAGSRTALWQTFAAERGLRTLATDMSIPEDVDRICTLLSGQVR